MFNWISITPDDLNDAKASVLVNQLRTAVLATGQLDPTYAIIEGVTAEIRANIKGCKSNLLDSDESTIPKELKALALRMVVREAQSRVRLKLNDDERAEQVRDDARLVAIRKCELPVQAPDKPQTIPEIQQGGAVQVATKPVRTASHCQLEGL